MKYNTYPIIVEYATQKHTPSQRMHVYIADWQADGRIYENSQFQHRYQTPTAGMIACKAHIASDGNWYDYPIISMWILSCINCKVLWSQGMDECLHPAVFVDVTACPCPNSDTCLVNLC